MPGNDPITTSIAVEDGIVVLAVEGEIDLATLPAFDAAIADAEAQTRRALIVNLTGVDFLASAGLQALVAAHERVSRAASFAVVANGPATSRPIQLTGLDQIFSLFPTLPDALIELKKNSGSPN